MEILVPSIKKKKKKKKKKKLSRSKMKHKQKTKQKETKKKKTRPLSIKRRRGRVASEDNSNYIPSSVLFSKATPFETKRNELLALPVSATRLRMHMHMKQSSSLGQAIADLLGNKYSGRKDPATMFTRKNDPDTKPPFSKDPLLGAFSKSSVWGPERFQKAPDWCGYV